MKCQSKRSKKENNNEKPLKHLKGQDVDHK